jgi:predicted RND superfamily exporter protein
VLTENAEETARILKELKEIHAREMENSPFASLSVIEDVYPAHQERKEAILNELNRLLTPKVRESLSKDEAALVRDFLPSPMPAPFPMAALPPAILKGYQETDGRLQTVLQVFPRLNPAGSTEEAHGTWNGEEVIRYTALLREAIRKSGVRAVILGQNPISADMLEAIEKDGPKATLFAFLAVSLLVVLLFPRWSQAAPMLLSLVLGILWMVGVIGALRWRINFLNFIALPITFGIGVDYSVNIFGRLYRDRKSGMGADVIQVIRETGGAVVLCSLTTTIGYGSLLLSGSQAFVSFGKLAVTGELTCVSAAVLSLPSLWLLLERKA